MKLSIGYVLILCMGISFSLLFLELSHKWDNTQSVDSYLQERVEIDDWSLPQTSMIKDKHGTTVTEFHSPDNRLNLSMSEIPDGVIDAFIATEDQLFYNHSGFDVSGMTRALFTNIQANDIVQGGSTITQQLVRNIYLGHTQTYDRKLTELLYAYIWEQEYTKEEILEAYINAVYFHNGAYGIEAASQLYFTKTAEQLTIAEAAFLASIPNNPSNYNPFLHKERTIERQHWVLQRMKKEGYIDEPTYEEAIDEPIELNPREKQNEYPDYTDYVLEELDLLLSQGDHEHAEDLIALLNIEEEGEKDRVKLLLQHGVVIETGLDPDIQTHLKETEMAHIGEGNIQSSSVVIEHRDHALRGISGGIGYETRNFHRGSQAYRQPGSAIKPILSFAPYLERFNVNRHSIISARPFNHNGYQPSNYGGAIYGDVPLAVAFQQSINTAAVRMLSQVGVQEAFSKIAPFSFAKVNEEDAHLPAALGGMQHGVSPLELTDAFTSFANDGQYSPAHAIERITDHDGNVLYEHPLQPTTVWSQSTAQEIRYMMQRVIQNGTGRHAAFSTDEYLGGKTGTSNNYHDLWFVGSTDRYTVGLWVGSDRPTSLRVASNQQLHTQTWRQIVEPLTREGVVN
ncbi:transglycosylase domain-containing protein [Texcoconibacillus texcoconensis]|uniref:Penicillin-binding protein 1A n=1 Tax=Texcoconibacillus texcoconensis TaxID=1095777 RepID=A0A840QPT1_9BACI|nr:transglycosylase domain-containing protein [Texcoconibacillus texcoconensis]MBB5173341.1 penicillin-binding protein 1A [Texcoconibacillus texcoconensis]